jgi:hypothetical protein
VRLNCRRTLSRCGLASWNESGCHKHGPCPGRAIRTERGLQAQTPNARRWAPCLADGRCHRSRPPPPPSARPRHLVERLDVSDAARRQLDARLPLARKGHHPQAGPGVLPIVQLGKPGACSGDACFPGRGADRHGKRRQTSPKRRFRTTILSWRFSLRRIANEWTPTTFSTPWVTPPSSNRLPKTPRATWF